MTENNGFDAAKMMQDIAKEAQAGASFGIAEKVSLKIGKEKFTADAEAEIAALDMDTAKAKIEKSGCSKLMAELSAATLDARAFGAEAFANIHNWRETGRLNKAQRERQHIVDIININKDISIADNKADVMDARVKTEDKDLSAGKGFWKGIVGGALEKIGLVALEAYKGWEKHWMKVNNKDAEAFAERKRWAKQRADSLRARATEKRTNAYAKFDAENATTALAAGAAADKAAALNESYTRNVDRNYLMPEAQQSYKDVVASGGDEKLAVAKANAEKWTEELAPKQPSA